GHRSNARHAAPPAEDPDVWASPDAAERAARLDKRIADARAELSLQRRPARAYTRTTAGAIVLAALDWGAFGVHALFAVGGAAAAPGLLAHMFVAAGLTTSAVSLGAVWVWWSAWCRRQVRQEELAADEHERVVLEIGRVVAVILREGDLLAEARLSRAQRLLDTPGRGSVTEFPGRGPRGR
ncbi:hypothetical protein C1I95_22650, partial [Micromonospora craterilacus]